MNYFNPLNFITAFSNVACLVPLAYIYEKKDYVTFSSLLFLFGASFSSHLIENHKHGMGIPTHSKKLSYILNKLDVAGAVLLATRMAFVHMPVVYKLTWVDALATVLTGCIGYVSEMDKTSNSKRSYIILHSSWHIGVFALVYRVFWLYYN
jgi:hypothetical protein